MSEPRGRVKIITVEMCCECPFCEEPWWCGFHDTGGHRPPHEGIPDWCPLDDLIAPKRVKPPKGSG